MLGRGIGDGDAPVVLDADHGRRHAREHRLDEPAPVVHLILRLDDLVALRADFGDHLVEGTRQAADIAIHRMHGHDDIQIAARTLSAAPINRRIGRTIRSATAIAVQIAARSTISAKPR